MIIENAEVDVFHHTKYFIKLSSKKMSETRPMIILIK